MDKYKTNALVTALHNYDLGKYIATKSDAIKKRGDNDKLGDLAFTQALEIVQPVSGGALKQFSVGACEKLCGWISKAVAKLHEAFVWSPARLEEQSDTLRQMGKLLVQICLQVDFALSDDLVRSCYDEFQAIVQGWPVDTQQAALVQKCAPLVAKTEDLMIDIMQRRDSDLPKLEAAIEVTKKFYTTTLMPQLKTIGKDLGDEFKQYVAKFDMVAKRQAMWRSLLSGVIDFAELLARPAQSFEDALPAWTEHKRLCSATSGEASSPQTTPYLNYVLSFASARRVIIDCCDTG